MFVSMWISNTATTTMMIPIIETVLAELETVRNLAGKSELKKKLSEILQQRLGDMFIQETSFTQGNWGESTKRPTRSTTAYFLAACYGSSLGGVGTMVGTGTNLTMIGIFEK